MPTTGVEQLQQQGQAWQDDSGSSAPVQALNNELRASRTRDTVSPAPCGRSKLANMNAQERIQFLLALQHPNVVVTSYASQPLRVMEAAMISARSVPTTSLPTIPPLSLPAVVVPPSPMIPPAPSASPTLQGSLVLPASHAPSASPAPLPASPAGFTMVPTDLVHMYNHHRDIIEDLLPSCELKNWSASYKAYKQVELVLLIAVGVGMSINYSSSSVISSSPQTPTLERMISGLGLISGVYGTFQNKLTLYFRVITFLEKCEQVQAQSESELPANILYCYRQCAQWHKVEPKDLSPTASAFTNVNPMNVLRKQLATFIVSSFFEFSRTRCQTKFQGQLDVMLQGEQ
jgi:hypothetical protein